MRVIAMALFILGLVVLISLADDRTTPVWPALFLLLLATPASLFSTYLASLRRIRNMVVWSPRSCAQIWLSGPWLRVLGGITAACAAAAFLAPRLVTLHTMDAWLMAGSTLVFFGMRWWFMPLLQGEVQPVYRFGLPLWWIAVATALSMVVADLVIRHTAAPGIEALTLAEAIQQAGPATQWLGTSALATAISDWAGMVRGLEIHLIARIRHGGGQTGWLLWPVLAMTQLPFYLFLALSMAAFALPARELTRILLPPQACINPAPVPEGRLSAASCLLTVLVGCVFLPLVVMLEMHLQSDARVRALPGRVQQLAVELIDGVPVLPGTAVRLRQWQMEGTQRRDEAMEDVKTAYHDGFAQLRNKVDDYLDWYYSLGAEYVRLFNVATGGLEAHLQARLRQTLGEDDPFARLQSAIDRALWLDRQLSEEFEHQTAELLESRRIEMPLGTPLVVTGRFTLRELQPPDRHTSLTTIEQRFAVGGATGVVSTLVARQLVMRMAARGTLRMAAGALSRAALARSGAALGGAGAGAATGAALGSMIPGLGTAAGAVVGGAVGGLGIGLGTEFLLLKTEELFRREAHRKAMLDSIDNLEEDLAAQLGLALHR